MGGCRHDRDGEEPIIPFDGFTDNSSGQPVRVHSGCLHKTSVEPSAGGYQAVLDASVLACEARAHDALRMYKETLFGNYLISFRLLTNEGIILILVVMVVVVE